VMEGVTFRFKDGSSTQKLGQGRRAPLNKKFDTGERKICKIAVTYNESQITCLEFIDQKGKRIGSTT